MTVIASIKIKQSGVNFLNKDYTCTRKERGEIPGRQTSRGNLDNNLSIFQGTQIFNCSTLNRKWLRDDKIKDLQ